MMSLRVLGTQSPYPRNGRACSSYLVQTNKTSVLLDLGSGTLAELTRHLEVTEIGAIVLTHNHADHASDTLCLYYALGFSELEPKHYPIVFGPSDWDRRMEAFLLSSAPNPMTRVFDVRKMNEAAEANVGAVHISWVAVDHGVEAYACRVSDGRNTVVYSGDTRRCESLVQLARDADVLLCEVGAAQDGDAMTTWHMTPEHAAHVAREADVGRLILTHLAPGLDPRQASLRAAHVFGRPVEIASQGEILAI